MTTLRNESLHLTPLNESSDMTHRKIINIPDTITIPEYINIRVSADIENKYKLKVKDCWATPE